MKIYRIKTSCDDVDNYASCVGAPRDSSTSHHFFLEVDCSKKQFKDFEIFCNKNKIL